MGESGGPGFFCHFGTTGNGFCGNERSGSVMNRNKIAIVADSAETGGDREMSFCAAFDAFDKFGNAESVRSFVDVIVFLRRRHDPYLGDIGTGLKREEGAHENSFAAQIGEELVKTHPATPAGSDDDSGYFHNLDLALALALAF